MNHVALATPRIALRLVRSPQPPLAGSMILGALLTMGADFVVRVAPGLSGLPVDKPVAMREGRIVAQGPPADALTEPLLDEIFGLSAKIMEDSVSGTPLVVPVSAHLRG
ncbi:hypothetical protein SAMN04489731_101644 [Amycolatopsis regifaucium]|nr:hypothetical protein SAMN04489731_101644 [Amycolatopsis regifaucium]